MARFIPENAETREFPAAAVVAYCYESKRGPALLAYKGRQSKPARFLAFGSAEARDRSLASFVEYEEGIETRKRERQQAGHGLAVGDIVYSVLRHGDGRSSWPARPRHQSRAKKFCPFVPRFPLFICQYGIVWTSRTVKRDRQTSR
ncbi:hypothetical protein J5X32_001763 [Escherichia coli]|nr:hypothetical protein [Escherichia coli]